ncbi:hypothetical protein AYO44_04195 [Planctomycetaceae bacterium SCGC AG-212-F19]|nr:hypothetical protein AYO44_04195 [Planctomycetaceae bacterium SCGC AG-212-F19]
MVTPITAQTEPIPGYTLIAPLGQGGFGEVWKARAPGGIPKAIKFVKGNLNDIAGKVPAVQELKALNRVKEVRHPFILGIERVDIIDGQLIIVMELADKNLGDRLRECQATGLPGIPRNELLRYMEETAEALDLMNGEYQLQHLDIKPANLFVVHHHVKIADFGLVKDLQGMTATITSGMTPIYAAPETFEGKVSRFCDQYSLAIVYQELLTGRRPYTGKNPWQLAMQHVSGTPDLAALPPADRAIVQKALAKQAGDRFGCCANFVGALRQAPDVAVTLPSPATALSDQPTPSAADALKKAGDATPLEPLVSPSRPGMRKETVRIPIANPTPPTEPASEKPGTNTGPRSTPRWQDCWLNTPTTSGPKATNPTFHRSRNKTKRTQAAPPSDVPCPHCGAGLADPGPLEWCGKCGYGSETVFSPRLVPQTKPVPTWSWVLLCALAMVVAVAAAGQLLSAAEHIPGLGSLLPLIAGIAALGVVVVVLYLIWPVEAQPKKKK